jgi:hypothetical protein
MKMMLVGFIAQTVLVVRTKFEHGGVDRNSVGLSEENLCVVSRLCC